MGNVQTLSTVSQSIVFIGDKGVGKTTLVKQLVEKDQSRTSQTTEAKFYGGIDLGSIKDDSINLVTNIWDTPGDEKFPTEILEDADVIIMVYSTFK